MEKPALLALADGTLFHGVSIGAEGHAVGEVVFNTAMTGYQEILTDPSYYQQIVTFTYPHIGNTGINPDDVESERVWVSGLVIRNLSLLKSNWRSEQSLGEYLRQQKTLGIAEIDTRKLTRILRDKGAQNGCITTDVAKPEQAIKLAKEFPGLEGVDLAKVVTTKKPYEWHQGTIDIVGAQHAAPSAGLALNPEKGAACCAPTDTFHIVAYDYGLKQNILRLLADRNCRVTVIPAQTPAKEVIFMRPDGILLTNGPGDPAACDYAITAIKELLTTDIPIYGICLGFQLLALASDAKTVKMKFGHHGANHPVVNTKTGKVSITSQNHGFAVNEQSLPKTLEITHRSLFDGTLQGIRVKNKPAFAFQGHPEASPGPHDIYELFDEFIELMNERRA